MLKQISRRIWRFLVTEINSRSAEMKSRSAAPSGGRAGGGERRTLTHPLLLPGRCKNKKRSPSCRVFRPLSLLCGSKPKWVFRLGPRNQPLLRSWMVCFRRPRSSWMPWLSTPGSGMSVMTISPSTARNLLGATPNVVQLERSLCYRHDLDVV